MQSHPVKQKEVKMHSISINPALFNKSIFPLVEKGSSIPVKDLDFENISSGEYPIDNLYSL